MTRLIFLILFIATSLLEKGAAVEVCATPVAHESDKAALETIESWSKEARILVVVDGYSDGARYATECRRLFPKVKIIHLQSHETLPKGLAKSFKPETYDVRVVSTSQTYWKMVAALLKFHREKVRVLAGCETGVLLTDELTHHLGVLGNGTHFSKARRDKDLAAQILAPVFRNVKGMRTIPGTRISSPSEFESILSSGNLKYPLALKPVGSAGAFGFHAGRNQEELKSGFDKYFGKPDPLGLNVSQMLLQPLLKGRVIALNLTSHPEIGTAINDLWESTVELRGSHMRFLESRMVRFNHDNPRHLKIAHGARLVKQGLEVFFGPIHPEFLETEDGTLYFMDVGARPAGGGLTRASAHCGGFDQIRATLTAAFHPHHFQYVRIHPPHIHKECALLYLAPRVSGRIAGIPSLEEIKARIPTLQYAHIPQLETKTTIEEGDNLFEQPGYLVVKGDHSQLDAAREALREWEARDFYKLAP